MSDQFARYHRTLMGTAIGTLVRRIYDRLVAKPTDPNPERRTP